MKKYLIISHVLFIMIIGILLMQNKGLDLVVTAQQEVLLQIPGAHTMVKERIDALLNK